MGEKIGLSKKYCKTRMKLDWQAVYVLLPILGKNQQHLSIIGKNCTFALHKEIPLFHSKADNNWAELRKACLVSWKQGHYLE